MALTLAEKILSRKVGRDVHRGEIIVAPVDLAYSHDANRPMPMELLATFGKEQVWDPARYVLCLDHYPAPTSAVAVAHRQLRDFAERQGVRLLDVGEGISHTTLSERGLASPGDLIVASDSHACTLGAVGAFATGVGSTDLAAVLATGKIWLRVPETLRIECHGSFRDGVTTKDLALHIAREIGVNGANYMALEFGGTAVEALPMHARFTLTNMSIEYGAKTGLVPVDATTLSWLSAHGSARTEAFGPDPDATYARVFEIDLDRLDPIVAAPHSPGLSRAASTFEHVHVDQVVIGTCCNGRLDDLALAARVLKGRKCAAGTRLYVTPGSRQTMAEAAASGVLGVLIEAGATIGTPGCNGCVGGCHWAIPGDDDVVVTTANRNFKGRLGNPKAEMYLASPATAAASAVLGRIADPRELLESRP